jgi:hypothetical protein
MKVWKFVLLGSGYSFVLSSAFLVNWELGAGAATLIVLIHSILAILKKYGEVVIIEEDVEIPSQQAPVKKKKTSPSRVKAQNIQKTQNVNAIAGLNQNIFAQFQSNLKDKVEPEGEPLSDKNLTNKPVPSASSRKQSSAPLKAYTSAKNSFDEVLGLEQPDKITLKQKKAQAKKPIKVELEEEAFPAPPPRAQSSAPELPPTHSQLNPYANRSKNLLKELAKSVEHSDEDDLFADVQIPLLGESRGYGSEQSNHRSNDDFFDEGLSSSLKSYASPEEKKAEADALLKMAENSFKSELWEETRASLDNYFILMEELGFLPEWDVWLLYAKVCLKEGNITKAVSCIEKIKEDGLEQQHPDYVKTMEALVAGLEEQHAFQPALPLLHDLLNFYRQQLDRIGMDNIYDRIERALEVLEDDERLIRIYKNHLEIKRILKDQYGESRLLDLIGNRYYKMGNKELSRQYYEDNLRIKAAIEKSNSSS